MKKWNGNCPRCNAEPKFIKKRSIGISPVKNTFAFNCVKCHTNFEVGRDKRVYL